MKKVKMAILSCAMAVVMASVSLFAGCGLFGGDNNNDDNNNNNTPTEYTIQYTDDVGSHTITVTDGAPYSLEVIPERLGYDFLGLFDAEVGGTQYVSANGSSLAPFTDKKNMVLFPQFAAKEYTVVLDYQGATITGQRSVTVKYGEKLPELPKNLSKEHSVFAGWYTEANCGGIQVSDNASLIPDKSTVNESLFDIEGAGEYLYLYAGFNVETFTVTFNFGNGIQSQEIKVEYNTPISQIVPDVRNSEGEAVLSWSKTSNGSQIFTGNITDNMVLYAAEWAPVIELNSNGGDKVTPIVAKVGASVTLPTPVRANYKFMGWQDEDGEIAEIATMPAGGARLTASWQAMLVFDENGGTEVNDISQPVGTAITLPTPEKEGYVFAGWYTSNKTKYTATSMPAAGVALKAGWYISKTVTIITKNDSNDEDDWAWTLLYDPGTNGPKETWRTSIDLSNYIGEGNVNISITLHMDMKTSRGSARFNAGLYLYDGPVVSDSNYITRFVDSVVSTSFKTYEFSSSFLLRGNILYLCYYAQELTDDGGTYIYFNNIWSEITYPDTSTLYL